MFFDTEEYIAVEQGNNVSLQCPIGKEVLLWYLDMTSLWLENIKNSIELNWAFNKYLGAAVIKHFS